MQFVEFQLFFFVFMITILITSIKAVFVYVQCMILVILEQFSSFVTILLRFNSIRVLIFAKQNIYENS